MYKHTSGSLNQQDIKMPKNSDLTESERYQIIGFHKAGFSRNNINKMLGFSKTSITQTIHNHRNGKIPESVYMDLVKSMPRRIEACIANNGWPTKY